MVRDTKGRFVEIPAKKRSRRRFTGIRLIPAISGFLALDGMSRLGTNLGVMAHVRNLFSGEDQPAATGGPDIEIRELLAGRVPSGFNLGDTVQKNLPRALTQFAAAGLIEVMARGPLRRPRARANKLLRDIGLGSAVQL